MALFKFTRAMIAGEAIDVYNQGQMKRDFTYIDDIAEAIVRLQDVIPQQDDNWTVETGSPATSSAPYRVYNIGNSQPVTLMNYIEAIEKALGITARKALNKASVSALVSSTSPGCIGIRFFLAVIPRAFSIASI